MMRFNHNFTSDDEVRGLLSAMVPGVARIEAEYWLNDQGTYGVPICHI